MPQCTLEYTDNLVDRPDMRELLLSIHKTLVNTGEFEESKIKSKALKRDFFVVADGVPQRSFVCLAIYIMEGRSDALKAKIAERAIVLLEAAFSKSIATGKCSLTVQVREIDKKSYKSR